MTDCYNKSAISNPGSHVGGVVGQSRSGAKVENCYNVGAVSGKTNVGAVVGQDQNTGAANVYYLEGSADYGVGSTSDASGRQNGRRAARGLVRRNARQRVCGGRGRT